MSTYELAGSLMSDGGDDDFNARNARGMDIFQRKIDAQIEPAADGEARQQELKTRAIKLIRTYLRNFKVPLPDEIHNMIKFYASPLVK